MYRIIATFMLTIFGVNSIAQDTTADTIKAWTQREDFDKIIQVYGSASTTLSAASLYYIGLAYFMKSEDSSCIRFMDLSINKSSKDHRPYFIKASTLNYMNRFEAAIPDFQKAIQLAPDTAEYYSGLADSYFGLKKTDLALEAYKAATAQKTTPSRPFMMIAQIYSDRGQEKEELEAFYHARKKITKGTEPYHRTLFNIGLIEMRKGDDIKAENAFVTLTQSDPSDFHAYAKLIQIYFRQKKYEMAKPYKNRLYDAHKNGLLTDNMKDMFCFDQFNWNDKLIQVFERYEEGPSSKIFNKHLFYVVNKQDSIEFRLQTEYSPISVELGGQKYILCAWKGKTHINYGIGINDNFDYEDLKKTVVKILEKEIKPVATLEKSSY